MGMSSTLPGFMKLSSFASCDSLAPSLRSLLRPITRCCKSRIFAGVTSNSLRKAASRRAACSSPTVFEFSQLRARRRSVVAGLPVGGLHQELDVRLLGERHGHGGERHRLDQDCVYVGFKIAQHCAHEANRNGKISLCAAISAMRQKPVHRVLTEQQRFLGAENPLFNVLSAQARHGLSSYKMGANSACAGHAGRFGRP